MKVSAAWRGSRRIMLSSVSDCNCMHCILNEREGRISLTISDCELKSCVGGMPTRDVVGRVMLSRSLYDWFGECYTYVEDSTLINSN